MTTSRCAIFIDKNKVDSDVKGYFDECGVEVAAYGVDEVEKWIKVVKGLRGEVKSEFKVFAPKSISWALATAVGIVSVDPYACFAPLHSISTSIYIHPFHRTTSPSFHAPWTPLKQSRIRPKSRVSVVPTSEMELLWCGGWRGSKIGSRGGKKTWESGRRERN
jgi:hypothetical protein